MPDSLSTTGRLRVTLDIDWPHTFGEKASAVDIYKTVSRECELILTQALKDAGVRYKIVGDVEPIMVVYPCKK